MYQKSKKYKIDDFKKSLSNGKKVLDFSKIAQTPYPIVLIISERGRLGKTLNVKEHLRETFLKNNLPNMWISNTIPFLNKTKNDWFKDLNKDFVRENIGDKAVKFWEETKFKGGINDNLLSLYHNKNEFIKMLVMNHAELMKGARTKWGSIVWDEFNVKYNVIQNAIGKFDSLLHSIEDVVAGDNNETKLYIFGNNKTLNIPLIYNLGITHIDNEIMTLHAENGLPLALVIAPKYNLNDKEKIETENSDNWIYQTTKQLGTHKHAYFNESLHDNINNVVRYKGYKKFTNLIPHFSVFHKNRYYNAYRNKISKKYHFIECISTEIFNNALFAFTRNDVLENSTFTRRYIAELRKFIENDYITFEDISTRQLFISSIR